MASAIILYVMEQYATPVKNIVDPNDDLPEAIPNSSFVLTDQGFRHKSEVPADEEDEWFRRAGW